MKVLHLTLSKKCFDDIVSGKKKEEYREFKQYWIVRLFVDDGESTLTPKKFDAIVFKNGYSKNVPTIKVEWKGTYYAPNLVTDNRTGETIVIELGEVIGEEG